MDEYKESKFVGFDIEPTTEIKMSNMFCITYLQNQVEDVYKRQDQRRPL